MSLCQQFHGLLKKESKITTRSQHASRTFSYCDGEVVTDQELARRGCLQDSRSVHQRRGSSNRNREEVQYELREEGTQARRDRLTETVGSMKGYRTGYVNLRETPRVRTTRAAGVGRGAEEGVLRRAKGEAALRRRRRAAPCARRRRGSARGREEEIGFPHHGSGGDFCLPRGSMGIGL